MRRIDLRQPVAQLKITLEETDPPVWRRVLVPADIRLGRLHDVIQVAMGWEDYHLHLFEVGDRNYAVPSPDADDLDCEDERPIRLDQVLDGVGRSIRYVYDIGDDWWHTIELEAVLPRDRHTSYPVCVDGSRACPPEDVGGAGGYARFLVAIDDPSDSTHQELKDWVGGEWDAESFAPDDVNPGLAQLDL